MKFVFTLMTITSFLIPFAASAQMSSASSIANMSQPGTGGNVQVASNEPQTYVETVADKIISFFQSIDGQWSAPKENNISQVVDPSTKTLVQQPSPTLTNLKVTTIEENKWRFTFSLCEGPSCVEVSSVFVAVGNQFYICAADDCAANAELLVKALSDNSMSWGQAYVMPTDPENPKSIIQIRSDTDLVASEDGKTLELTATVYVDAKMESVTKITFQRNQK